MDKKSITTKDTKFFIVSEKKGAEILKRRIHYDTYLEVLRKERYEVERKNDKQ